MGVGSVLVFEVMDPEEARARAKAQRLADKRRYVDLHGFDRPRREIKKIEKQIASDQADLEDYRTLLDEARAKAPLPPGTSVVFLVRSGDRIKIDFSANYLGRISELKGAEMLLVLQGDRELKTDLVRRFGAYRLEGGGFADNPEIRAYIADRVEAGDNVSHRITRQGMTFYSYSRFIEGRGPTNALVDDPVRRGPTPGVRAGGLAQKRYRLDLFYPPPEQVGEIERQIASFEEGLEDYRTLLEEAKSRAEAPSAPFPIVYFVRRGDRIKIGFSTRFKMRMYQLQPDQILLVLEGDRKLESSLLRRFAAYHVGGEWFTDNVEIRAYIAECLEAGQNVHYRFEGRRRAY